MMSWLSELTFCAGLMVLERNWLDVYPYISWGATAQLPILHPGQQFIPTVLALKEERN